jgi:hypothetical protein
MGERVVAPHRAVDAARVAANPLLVVAIAWKPSDSRMRADPMSR